MTTTASTVCEAFQRTCAQHPEKVALRDAPGTVAVTWREYAERVRSIAEGLAALGVRRGDTVALLMTNRPEFHLVDTAVLHLGATPFSVYNTLAADQVAYVLGNAGACVVVAEEQFVEKVRNADATGQVRHLVCIDSLHEGTISLTELETLEAEEFDFEDCWQAVEAGDVATIIYTSGTTGPPKGVESTHANVIAEFEALDSYLDLDHDDLIISYLPDAHMANRGACHYNNLIRGVQVVTLANPKELVATLPDVRPTLFLAVPAIWYKVKAGIEATVASEQSAGKRALADWAIRTGVKVAELRSAGKGVPLPLLAQSLVADHLVLRKVRAKMGLDQLKLALTGAAPISPEAMAFMLGLGIPVCEVWGMSETTGGATMNPPHAIRIGTVGKVLPGGTELKLEADGELCVRGPIVMKGYRHAPEKTAAAIDEEGWLHTGDIASIDEDGYVRIVDRKKELIINAAGKNMSPSNIEGAVKVACPLVMTAVAIGDDKPYITALLTLDPDACAAYAAQHGLPSSAPAALADDPGVRYAIQAGIDAANEKLARVEQVKKFAILPTVWEPGGEELTPTMKLKRKPISEKYASEIDALYARGGGATRRFP